MRYKTGKKWVMIYNKKKKRMEFKLIQLYSDGPDWHMDKDGNLFWGIIKDYKKGVC